LFREANQLGLPPFEQAEAAHYLETFEGNLSSADAAVRAFVAVAEQRRAVGDDRGAIDALGSVLVRVFWGELSDDVRRDASELVRGLNVPPDDPLRLSFLGAVDPVRNGAMSSSSSGRSRQQESLTRWMHFTWGMRAQWSGRTS